MSKFSNLKLRYKVGFGLATTAAVLGMAGGAFAYFTDSGSGTGSASVGTSTPFVISGTDSSANYPGQSTDTELSVQNPGSGNQQIGTIYLANVRACLGTSSTWTGTYAGGSCTNSGTHVSTCESVDSGAVADANLSDWYMADVVENYDVPAGMTVNDASTPPLTDGTLKMNDLTSSQDSCKNVSLTLFFATR
jgi:hypothetical protein